MLLFTGHIASEHGIRTYVLDVVEIKSGTSATIEDNVHRIVRKFEINVTLVITDSVSTVGAFPNLLIENSPCCVHLLNLICKDAFSRCPTFVNCLEKIIQITGK